MSDRSGIEWTDATWNIVIGCDKVSLGCDHCYAIRTAHRMQAHPNPKVSTPYADTEHSGQWTGRVNLVHERLDLPLRWRKPRRIFVNAQSDLFHESVPDEFIAQVWAVMALAPRHTFQVLTKRHARMRSLLRSQEFWSLVGLAGLGQEAWLPESLYLPNVHLVVSVENEKWAGIRIPALLDTPAAVRGISAEPLLGSIDLTPYTAALDWVIVGGESGPGARPMHPTWVRALRDQCTDEGVAFLFKQWGEWTPEHGHRYSDLHQFDDDPESFVMRVGKHTAGRELDGRTWDQYPQPTQRHQPAGGGLH